MPLPSVSSPCLHCERCEKVFSIHEHYKLTEMICICRQHTYQLCYACKHQVCSCGGTMLEKWLWAESEYPGYCIQSCVPAGRIEV